MNKTLNHSLNRLVEKCWNVNLIDSWMPHDQTLWHVRTNDGLADILGFVSILVYIWCRLCVLKQLFESGRIKFTKHILKQTYSIWIMTYIVLYSTKWLKTHEIESIVNISMAWVSHNMKKTLITQLIWTICRQTANLLFG